MMSVTIDVIDIMFLAFVEQCEHFYNRKPIDRGHHGLQFKFDYCSPNEAEHYGSISLTFYPSTARLHVQGSSYLLWVEEHLPSLYANTEAMIRNQVSKWSSLSRQRGIGRKRESRPLCTNADSSGICWVLSGISCARGHGSCFGSCVILERTGSDGCYAYGCACRQGRCGPVADGASSHNYSGYRYLTRACLAGRICDPTWPCLSTTCSCSQDTCTNWESSWDSHSAKGVSLWRHGGRQSQPIL